MKHTAFAVVIAAQLVTVTAFADPPKARAKTTATARKIEVEKPVEETAPPPPPPAFTVVCATPAAAAPAPAPVAAPAAPAPAPAKPVDADKTESDSAPPNGTRFELLFGHTAKGLGLAGGIQVAHTNKSGLSYGGAAVYQNTEGENVRALYTEGMIGWEFRAGDVKIMPYIGAGQLTVIASVKGDTKTDSTPLIVPGVGVHYDFKSGFTVGADARMLYLTDADESALALHASVGYRF